MSPGPSGANEGSRWEGSTLGRTAPTGLRPETCCAPAGRMNLETAVSHAKDAKGATLKGLKRGFRAAIAFIQQVSASLPPFFVPLRPLRPLREAQLRNLG